MKSKFQNTTQRRNFIKGAALGTALIGVGFSPSTLFSAIAENKSLAITDKPKILHGTEFHLEIAQSIVNFTGTPQIAKTINQQLPGPNECSIPD